MNEDRKVELARQSARGLILLSVLLALLAGALALGLTLLGGTPCPSYPSCILNPTGSVLTAHILVSGVLGLTVLVTLPASLPLRRRSSRVLPLELATLALLVVMAGIGQGLSSGALPSSFLYVQTGFLALLLVLLGLTWRGLRSGPAPAAPSVAATAPSTP